MGCKQDRLVSLEKQVKELSLLRIADNQKFSAKLAQERKEHAEALKGLSSAVAKLQEVLDALKGIVAPALPSQSSYRCDSEHVPASFGQGLKDCDEGRTVGMEKALAEPPPKPIPPPNRLIKESDGG